MFSGMCSGFFERMLPVETSHTCLRHLLNETYWPCKTPMMQMHKYAQLCPKMHSYAQFYAQLYTTKWEDKSWKTNCLVMCPRKPKCCNNCSILWLWILSRNVSSNKKRKDFLVPRWQPQTRSENRNESLPHNFAKITTLVTFNTNWNQAPAMKGSHENEIRCTNLILINFSEFDCCFSCMLWIGCGLFSDIFYSLEGGKHSTEWQTNLAKNET